MKFLAPGWLWLLLALPLLYFFFAADEKKRLAEFERFANRALWRALVPELEPGARLRKAAMWLGSLAFVILALARPQWGSHEETINATGLDIMIALDVSNSMETEDVIPSRLKKARHLIKSLADQLKGDRVGIVAFAASSYVACPLTTDIDYVLDTLQILGPKIIASQGTDIGLGMDTARKALERGAEDPQGSAGGAAGAQESSSQPSRVVLLISDGEDHEDGAISAAQSLKDSGTKLYVMGVGTEKGGPVPVRDEAGNLVGYKRDRKGEPVVSKFRPEELMKVAQAGGGRYWNVTDGEDEIQDMLKDMGALNRTEYAERRYLVYEERFQFPLAIAVLLAFLEISLPVRRIRRSPLAEPRESGAARAAAPLLGLVVLALCGSRAAYAGGQPPIEAYLNNEKGIQAFNDGKIEDAEKKFGTAQALDPNLPELQYNQGLIQMQKGDAETAGRDFEDAARSAMEHDDPKLEGRSLYNLGGALSKKGDVDGAARSYLGAIAAAQRSRDPSLEADSRRNLQLLIHEREKKKQQQKEQNKDQKDQQKDPKDGKQDPNQQQANGQKQGQDKNKEQGNQDQQKDQKQAQGQGQQPKTYEDPSQSRREFSSPKLSKDDAERVMAELSNRERELQAKIRKQNGTPQQQINDKDW